MSLEVITGTMFGGKSTELVRRLERAMIAGQKVAAFSKDTRYSKGSVTTHSGRALKGIYVETSAEIDDYLEKNPNTQVIGIDECQFFDSNLIEVCSKWAGRGVRVIVAGLDQDFRTKPFEITLALMAEAETIDKLLAICTRCGKDAIRNHLNVQVEDRIYEGGEGSYEALCRVCFETATLDKESY